MFWRRNGLGVARRYSKRAAEHQRYVIRFSLFRGPTYRYPLFLKTRFRYSPLDSAAMKAAYSSGGTPKYQYASAVSRNSSPSTHQRWSYPIKAIVVESTG